MASNETILIIDDEKPIRDVLSASLEDENYQVETAENGAEGLEKIRKLKPAIVLLDIWMPGDLDGIDVLREAKKSPSITEFIVMSGHGTIETAVKATKLGAWDFVEKPLSLDKIHILLNNIFAFQKERSQKFALLNKLRKSIAIIGDSVSMRETKERIANLPSKAKLISINGPIGSGKSLVAENIHYFSERVGAAFVSMNCALSPEELIESEIFGFEKEAFTGAPSGKMGKLELVAGGTLFIKEAHLMPASVYEKIQDYIDSSKFRRLKGSEDIYCNTRIILSTHKSFSQIKDLPIGKFWENVDPEYRFNLISLKERKEDLPALIDHFANHSAKESGVTKKRITNEALSEMTSYDWPVNIRELKNFVERLYLMVTGDEISEESLGHAGLHLAGARDNLSVSADSLKEARAVFEKEFILKKLSENEGNVSKTAEAIGLERSHLHRKIKGYGIDL